MTFGQRNNRDRANNNKPRAPRRFATKKVDEFARLKIDPDYKDVQRLQRYLTPQGKILPRRRTGLNAKTQRKLTIAIKRARHLALLPFVSEGAPRR